nr:Fur4 [Starmerella bombicola]
MSIRKELIPSRSPMEECFSPSKTNIDSVMELHGQVTQVEGHSWQPKKPSFRERMPKNWKDWRQWRAFLEATPSQGLSTQQMFLYAEDLKPVESARRTWTWLSYVNVWIADSVNVSTWQIAGTGVEAGLTWWETWLAIWLGYFIAAGLITICGRVGSYAHIGFPVACRSAFGVYGSVWPVINRVVLAIIWFGSQTWVMGTLILNMLYAVFGKHVDEHIGLGNLSGTTVAGFVSFFIAWCIQFPFLLIPPHKMRFFFTAKAVIAPAVSIALLIWTLVRAHGAGSTISQAHDGLSTSARAWAFINMMMNCIANYAALILNAPDFTRFAKYPRSANWSQFFTIPISFSITSLIGLLVASASKVLTPDHTFLWNPVDLLKQFIISGSAGDRGGGFIISAGLVVAQIGTNIMANSYSASMDLTSLCPMIWSVRRGAITTALLGLAICPWHFYESGSKFTTYLSAYAIFLSSISGVIVCDYYWLRHGEIKIFDLYSNEKSSPYMYNTRWGCNWRGYAAYLLALVPNMPGFAGQCGRSVPEGAIKLYYFNYIVGFGVAFLLYMAFNTIWPPTNVPEPLKGRLFDRKAPWLERDLDVDNFSELYRFGTGTGVVDETLSITGVSANKHPSSEEDKEKIV